MEVPSTQLVSGIWAESPLSPFELKCHHHTASPITSNGRVFLSSHYSVTLSDPSTTLGLQMGVCVFAKCTCMCSYLTIALHV